MWYLRIAVHSALDVVGVLVASGVSVEKILDRQVSDFQKWVSDLLEGTTLVSLNYPPLVAVPQFVGGCTFGAQ